MRKGACISFRPVLILALIIGCGAVAAAEDTGVAFEGAAEPDLDALNAERLLIQKTGMYILGSWALLNFGVGGFMMTRTEERPYYFHQGNVFWNVVNAGIAAFSLISAYRHPGVADMTELLKEYTTFTRVLLINAGLDLGYITAGILLRLKGGGAKREGTRLEGYGLALILQGGFLLLFDSVLAIINHTVKQGL